MLNAEAFSFICDSTLHPFSLEPACSPFEEVSDDEPVETSRANEEHDKEADLERRRSTLLAIERSQLSPRISHIDVDCLLTPTANPDCPEPSSPADSFAKSFGEITVLRKRVFGERSPCRGELSFDAG